MSWNQVVWAFSALLIVGGVVGFLKARSKASLIASVGSAIPLALAAAGILPFWVVPLVLGSLMVIFAKRLATTRKFMPSGMLLIVTVLTAGIVWASIWKP